MLRRQNEKRANFLVARAKKERILLRRNEKKVKFYDSGTKKGANSTTTKQERGANPSAGDRKRENNSLAGGEMKNENSPTAKYENRRILLRATKFKKGRIFQRQNLERTNCPN